MTDTIAKKSTKATKPKAAPAHPPVATMVTTAITSLKERNGSSLAAIKKYISANYKCDVAKVAPFIRKFLKKAVEEGKLKQIKASYKVDKTKIEKPKKPAKKPAAKPKTAKKSPKKAAKHKKEKTDKPKKEKPAKKEKKAKTPKKVSKPKKAKTPKKAASKPKPKKAASKKTPKKAAKK